MLLNGDTIFLETCRNIEKERDWSQLSLPPMPPEQRLIERGYLKQKGGYLRTTLKGRLLLLMLKARD